MNSVEYPYQVHKILVHNNVEIAYCETGNGPSTLLFIHGLANYLPVWQYQMTHFGQSHRCIAIDLPGNGMSPNGDFPYTMAFYAEVVARFIEKKNLNSVILVGHSMGGQIAMILALRYPQLVEKLILVAPSGFEQFTSTEVMMMEHTLDMGQLLGMDASYLESTIRQSFYTNGPDTQTIINDLLNLAKKQQLSQWHEMIVGSIKSMLKEPVVQFLDQIEQPTLVIFGENDAMIPNKLIHFMETTVGIAKKSVEILKHAELHMVPLSGHFVQIEKAEIVNKHIQRFLETTH